MTPHVPPNAAAEAAPFRAHVPNLLTLLRLLLAAAFIAILSIYRYPEGPEWALPVSALLFILAAATDALDGYLARRWNAVSLFGRVMDPFADKVLILAAFILLAGPNFAPADGVRPATAVAPWMAAVILARELLVTSIRGVLEGRGVDFSAALAGKLKMIFQSGAVPAILLLLWLAPPEAIDTGWARWAISAIVWLTLGITLVSGWPYVARALTAARELESKPAESSS